MNPPSRFVKATFRAVAPEHDRTPIALLGLMPIALVAHQGGHIKTD